MNKSTPISQLPNANNNNAQTQNFVTDQQRQYISQAQNAISNSHMPQNTQLSADIINDDDVVVQDILNQINAPTDSSSQQNEVSQQQMQQQQMQQQLMLQQLQQQQNMASQQQLYQPNSQNQQAMLLAQMGGYGSNPYENIIQNAAPVEFKDYLLHFADDLKLASFIFFIVILVHFVPLDKFLARYFAIEKLPYHDILLRAMMAAIFIIIIKKLAKI